VTSFAATRPSLLGRTGSIGLWSPIAASLEDEEEDQGVPVLNFGFDKPSGTARRSTAPATSQAANPEADSKAGNTGGASDKPTEGAPGLSSERSPKPEPEQLGAGTGGLWGAPRPPDDADRLRDLSGSKRRWTVTERS
jgi:hypothetical protein